MTETFAVGDRVRAAGRVWTVASVHSESFPRGGVQQVVAARTDDGQRIAMRAAHFTHEPTEPCPGCDCDPIGYAPHNGKGTLCHKPTERESERDTG